MNSRHHKRRHFSPANLLAQTYPYYLRSSQVVRIYRTKEIIFFNDLSQNQIQFLAVAVKQHRRSYILINNLKRRRIENEIDQEASNPSRDGDTVGRAHGPHERVTGGEGGKPSGGAADRARSGSG